jgi:hypothetical protein
MVMNIKVNLMVNIWFVVDWVAKPCCLLGGY